MRTQLFRGMARTFIKPTPSPRVLNSARRRWIGLLTKANLTPRGTRYEALNMYGVPGERVTVGVAGEARGTLPTRTEPSDIQPSPGG